MSKRILEENATKLGANELIFLGLISALQSSSSVLRPNVEYSNSNVGFSLLGLAISNVTSLSYEESIRQSIILPLGLNSTGFLAPDARSGAIPKGNSMWSWDVGINNPYVLP